MAKNLAPMSRKWRKEIQIGENGGERKINPSANPAEAPFLDLNLSITNGIVSSKVYDKQDDFNFEIVNFPFLDGDVPRSPSYGAYSFC